MAKQNVSSLALSPVQSPLSADRIAIEAAIVSALAVATPKHVSKAKKPSKGVAYAVSDYSADERVCFALCVDLERHAYEGDNKRTALTAHVRKMFGDTAPTFAQYKVLQGAMYLQGVEACFDAIGGEKYTGQAMRKHIAAAVKTAYGALPVSDSPAAIAKRAQRPTSTPKVKADATTDTLSEGNATGGHVPAHHAETVEQFVARVGIVNVLAAVGRILDVEDATKAEAKAVRSVIGHLAAAA